MFDVGFSELILMAIVALVVLGPEKLPHAARVAGAWIGRLKRMVSTMQAEIEREVSVQEMGERLQKEIEAVRVAGAGMAIHQPLQEVNADMQRLQAEVQSSVQSALSPAVAVGPAINPVSSGSPDIATTANVLVPDDTHVLAASAPFAKAATPAVDVKASPVAGGETAYREWLAAQKRPALRAMPVPSFEAPPITKPSTDSTS